MGIASMIIGIVAVVISLLPFCTYFSIIPAVVGLVLGIIDLVVKSQNNEPRGISIAGVVLNSVALLAIIIWTIVLGNIAFEVITKIGSPDFQNILTNLNSEDGETLRKILELIKALTNK